MLSAEEQAKNDQLLNAGILSLCENIGLPKTDPDCVPMDRKFEDWLIDFDDGNRDANDLNKLCDYLLTEGADSDLISKARELVTPVNVAKNFLLHRTSKDWHRVNLMTPEEMHPREGESFFRYRLRRATSRAVHVALETLFPTTFSVYGAAGCYTRRMLRQSGFMHKIFALSSGPPVPDFSALAPGRSVSHGVKCALEPDAAFFVEKVLD